LEMKITDVEVTILSFAPEKPIADALNLNLAWGDTIVQLHTDEGLTGIGEACAPFASPLLVKAIVEKSFRQYLVGEEPFHRERIWEKMYLSSLRYGRKGVAISAISGVDIAIWDLIGKATNMPIYKLLGGYRDEVRAYASAGFYQESKGIQDLAEEMAQFPKRGFTAVKIKIGRDPAEDVERVRAVREAIGDKVDLIVDANAVWNPRTAIKFANRIEKHNILWFEEPVSADDLEGLATVTSKIDIPTSTGEQEYTRYGFRDLITKRAVDIVQPDVVTAGGISEAYKIAALASAHHLLCVPHTFTSPISLAANLHLIASIPNGFIVEFDTTEMTPLRDKLLRVPFQIDHRGFVKVPDGPGLGIELDEKTVATYREDLSIEQWKEAGRSLRIPTRAMWQAPPADGEIAGIP